MVAFATRSSPKIYSNFGSWNWVGFEHVAYVSKFMQIDNIFYSISMVWFRTVSLRGGYIFTHLSRFFNSMTWRLYSSWYVRVHWISDYLNCSFCKMRGCSLSCTMYGCLEMNLNFFQSDKLKEPHPYSKFTTTLSRNLKSRKWIILIIMKRFPANEI